MSTPCPVYKNPPHIVNFIATVEIPIGYHISNNTYSLHLTLDESDLKIDRTTQLRQSVVTIDPTTNPPTTMDCISKIYQFALHGTLFYNLIIQLFQTESSHVTSDITAFSASNHIPTDTILGFTCYECPEDEMFTEFKIEIVQGTEFVVTEIGAIIPYNEADPAEFFEALNNTKSSQVIQIPYTLTISGIVPTDPIIEDESLEIENI